MVFRFSQFTVTEGCQSFLKSYHSLTHVKVTAKALIHSDEGLTLETSVFETFTVFLFTIIVPVVDNLL